MTLVTTLLGWSSRADVAGLTPPRIFVGSEELRRLVVNAERDRSLRSGKPFALISLTSQNGALFTQPVISGVRICLRRYDVIGWMDDERMMVLLPEPGGSHAPSAALRLSRVLRDECGIEAEVAVLGIAARLGRNLPVEAAAPLDQVASTTDDEGRRTRARAHLQRLRPGPEPAEETQAPAQP